MILAIRIYQNLDLLDYNEFKRNIIVIKSAHKYALLPEVLRLHLRGNCLIVYRFLVLFLYTLVENVFLELGFGCEFTYSQLEKSTDSGQRQSLNVF